LKILFLSDSGSGVNIFPEMEEKLAGEIADLDIDAEFVPGKLDLPRKALSRANEFELIFVLCLHEEKDPEVDILKEKLVDVELQAGTPIIKAIEESGAEEIESEDQRAMEKEALTEKWSEFLLNYLFHPDKFVPEAGEV